MTRKEPVIAINFARTDFRALIAIRRGLAVLAVLSAVVLVLLILSARSLRLQGATAERQVRELASSEAKLRPVMEERQQLVGNLNAMSALVQARRFSWIRVLTRLEGVFPEGIALTRLDLNPRELTVALEGFAQSPEALSSLMIRLEQSQSFKNPLLKRQSMDKGILTFNVIVHYNDTPVGGTASGADRKRRG